MRKQSYPAAFYAAAAIAAMIGLLSAVVNGWFGWETGKGVEIANVPHLGVVTAGHGRAILSASSDLLKDFLSVLIIAALIAKGVRWWVRGLAVIACAALWVPLVVNSWTYASGAAALISSDSTSARAHEIEEKKRLLKDEARIEGLNRWTTEIQAYRDSGPSALSEKIEAHKLDKRWIQSGACAHADNEGERSYCREYHVLSAAKKTADIQKADHEELVKIKAQLAAMSAVPLVANPAGGSLAKSLGTSEDEALAFTSGLGAFLLEAVPTGLPAILYFFAVTILARPKEEEPVVAMPAPRQRPRTRVALAPVPDSAVKEFAKIEKPRKSAFQKIEEGLTEALSIAKGEAKPAETIEPPADSGRADTSGRDSNAIIGAAIRSLQPIAAKRSENKIAHAEIMEAIAKEGGPDIDPRTLSAFLKRAKGIVKIEGDRSRLNGQRQTWYQIAGRPKLESVA